MSDFECFRSSLNRLESMVAVASAKRWSQISKKKSSSECAPKQNDADGGGDEDARDRAHEVTERKRASALRNDGEQFGDKR